MRALASCASEQLLLSGTGYLPFKISHQFQIWLSRAIRRDNEMKGIQIGKKEADVYLQRT